MAIAYDAGLAGVQALLPHFTIGPNTRPSDADVERFLEMASNWVVMRLGDIGGYSSDLQTRVTGHAKGAVELRAAAQAEDAKYPERASVRDAGYAAVLRAQADAAIDEALEAMGQSTGAGGTGTAPSGPPGHIASHFPAPFVTRDQRF